jgi:hypothetical protein
MRQLYREPERGREIGQRARTEIRERLSPDACGARIVERLRRLADR